MPVDHYENFPVASLLLPARLREPIEAIYAFARSADDIADEGSDAIEKRLADLSHYDAQLALIACGQTPIEPMFARLDRAIREHQLPIGLFSDLIDAFKQDVTKTRYQTFVELMDYCRRSANPIGRLLLHLTGHATPGKLIQSDAICSALQLINHWQDVAIDWKKNLTGRVYLPQEELASHGVGEAHIASSNAAAEWSAFMAFQTQRARTLMQSGAPLAADMPGRFGLELRLIVLGGLAILDKIDAVQGDVFRHRPALTKWDWLRLLPRAFAKSAFERHVFAVGPPQGSIQ